MVQPLAVRVKGGTSEPQVVKRLTFLIASPSRSFFRSLDQLLPETMCRMVSVTEAPKMCHIGLGLFSIFSIVKADLVRCGVERRAYELCRTDASNDGSAGGVV